MKLKGEAEAVPWDVPDPRELCRRAAGPDDPVWDVLRPERGRLSLPPVRPTDLLLDTWDWNNSCSLLPVSGWNQELSSGFPIALEIPSGSSPSPSSQRAPFSTESEA